MRYVTEVTVQQPATQSSQVQVTPDGVHDLIQDHLAVYGLIRAYQVN